jgi:formimidoylglutamate deiminase
MVEAGVTHVGEFHYLHHAPDGTPYADPDELARRVISAARSVGLRITLLRVLYGRNGPKTPLQGSQRRFADRGPEDALAAVQRLDGLGDPLVTVGLAPHSVRAVPAPWLAELAGTSRPVHAHVAEQPGEIEVCMAEHGMPPLQVFEQAGLVDEHFTAVHLTHPAEGDVERLASAQAAVCVCPTTELDLGDGFFPVGARGLRLCLGSDSQARIDLLEDARSLELHARALTGRRNVMATPGERHALAARLLHAASGQGGRALGGAQSQGVTLGAAADLLALDLDRPAAVGVPPLEAAAFVGGPDWVSEVWVAGREVVSAGHHPLRAELMRAARPYLSSTGSG